MNIAMRFLTFYLSMVVVMLITLAVVTIWGRKKLREDLKDRLDELAEVYSCIITNDRLLTIFVNLTFAISLVHSVIVGAVTWPKFMYTSIKEGGIL